MARKLSSRRTDPSLSALGASATGEISRAVTQAATGTSELRGNIQTVAESARRSGQTASDMANAVSLVGQRCDELQVRVGEFLKRVRAG